MIVLLAARVLLKMRAAFWQVIYASYRRQYRIAGSFRFNGAAIQFYGNGDISCGEDSYVGELSTVQAAKGHGVLIGRKCRISHNVRIYTTTALADVDFTAPAVASRSASVTIADGVWIGANVFINPGVTIGSNAVVGANSVVTKSIGEHEIWGGVPARFIRRKDGVADVTTVASGSSQDSARGKP